MAESLLDGTTAQRVISCRTGQSGDARSCRKTCWVKPLQLVVGAGVANLRGVTFFCRKCWGGDIGLLGRIQQACAIPREQRLWVRRSVAVCGVPVHRIITLTTPVDSHSVAGRTFRILCLQTAMRRVRRLAPALGAHADRGRRRRRCRARSQPPRRPRQQRRTRPSRQVGAAA